MMRAATGRLNALLRGVVAAITLLVALAGFGSASAWAGVESTSARTGIESTVAYHSIIGSWAATVVSGTQTLHPTLIFNADGSVKLIAEHNEYIAAGSWEGAGGNKFTFVVTHPLLDGSGAVIGTVHGVQAGEVSGKTFTSVGPSQLYDLAGNRLGDPITVHITGTCK
jgi:hypothetical protein